MISSRLLARARSSFRASIAASAALVCLGFQTASPAQTLPVNQLRAARGEASEAAPVLRVVPKPAAPATRPAAPPAASPGSAVTPAVYQGAVGGAGTTARTAATSSVLRNRTATTADRSAITQESVPAVPSVPRTPAPSRNVPETVVPERVMPERGVPEQMMPGTTWMDDEPLWTDEGEYGDYYGPGYRPPFVGRLYASGEVLALWTKGMNTPTLVTTSPSTTSLAEMGVLGQPSTTVLFGGQGVNNDGRASGKVGLGFWLDPNCGTRIEANYLFAGDLTTTFNATSPATAVIARPFQNVTTGAQDAYLVAVPNNLSGSINVTATTAFNSLDVVWRSPIVNQGDSFVDMTIGYKRAELNDTLTINDSTTALVAFPPGSPVIPAGTTLSGTDQFQTANSFNGGQIGFAYELVRCRWSYELLLNLALGSTHSTTTINGSTNIRSANGATTTQTGGMLALPSNIGTYEQSNFSAITEVGLRMNYDFAPCWRFSAVYSLNYWSQVARAGDQVSTAIDPNQLPAPGTAAGTGIFPEYHFQFTDFWAQGVGLRLEHQF